MKAADLGGARRARYGFGNPTLVLEDARSVWGWPRLETVWQDLRYAMRMLRKASGFTKKSGVAIGKRFPCRTAQITPCPSCVRGEPILLDSPPCEAMLELRRSARRGARVGEAMHRRP
jgi:hypothetical protein